MNICEYVNICEYNEFYIQTDRLTESHLSLDLSRECHSDYYFEFHLSWRRTEAQ